MRIPEHLKKRMGIPTNDALTNEEPTNEKPTNEEPRREEPRRGKPMFYTSHKGKSKTEAISDFLNNSLSPIAKLYKPCMEVQVNVAKDNGVKYINRTKKNRTWRGYQDPDNPSDVWKNIRIPINANTNPVFRDTAMMFSLEQHAEGVGMTGWDWEAKTTRWVGFDFDSITNHSAGIDESELAKVRTNLEAIPWVEIVTSTSGEGIHAYVHIGGYAHSGGFPTDNHNEHAAVARSVLTVMSAECGYNFKSSVDCVGSILWCWHRKQEGTNGLKILKKAESSLPVHRVPKNWKDHISVVSRRTTQVIVGGGVKDLSAMTKKSRIDEDHAMILKWMSQNAKRNFWFNTDHNMVVGHTKDFEACYEDLDLRGLFTTKASGEDVKQNCFGFPRAGGVFMLYRYGKYTEEDSSWTTDKNGWVRINYNCTPTFHQACAHFGGLLDENNNFVFEPRVDYSSTGSAEKALSILGIELHFSKQTDGRVVLIRHNPKKQNISVKVTREKDDAREAGWITEARFWGKVFPYAEDADDSVKKDINVDEIIRSTQKNDQDYGWFINVNDRWVEHAEAAVNSVMATKMADLSGAERSKVKGECILNPYDVRDEPFSPEYPGGRVWNKMGAQLAYTPEKGIHPTWDSILKHIGKNLYFAVQGNTWCRENGIEDGEDYLLHWISYLFQEPSQQLPYLFIFGEQNTGKSSLHEALSTLFKKGRGYSRAEEALTSNFNGALEGTILAVIEEINLSKSRKVYDRIKDLVTAKEIAIRAMYKDVFMATNYCKFIHVSNYKNACPVFEGDTRVVVIEVDTIETEIDKHILFKRLHEEAPAFLDTVVNYPLPEKTGRLAIPVLETEAKTDITDENLNALEEYFKKELHPYHGEYLKLDDIFESFIDWLKMCGREAEVPKWGKKRVSSNIPKTSPFIKGQIYKAQRKMCVGNVSYAKPPESFKPVETYVQKGGGQLKKVKIDRRR